MLESLGYEAGVPGLPPHEEVVQLMAEPRELERAVEQAVIRCMSDNGMVIDTLKIARAAIAECFRWRPIEEAVLDGREVLLTVKKRAGVSGKMLVGHYMPGGHCIEGHPPIERGWHFWDGRMFDLAAEPTHYLPLAPPPEDAP